MDYMAQIANELVAEELEKPTIETLFFDNENKVLNWFAENNEGKENAA